VTLEVEPLIAPAEIVESEEDENHIAVNIYDEADKETVSARSARELYHEVGSLAPRSEQGAMKKVASAPDDMSIEISSFGSFHQLPEN
jgi:hypothetical protein